MKKPTRVLIWMSLFLLAVGTVVGLLFEPLREAFLANRIFNAMILGVFLTGVVINVRQVIVLAPEAAWIEAFRRNEIDQDSPLPTLLSPMAKMLTGRTGDRVSLSAMSMRTLLDGIRSRMDESRDLSRYMIGLLVFLGLLGTFWGLLATLASVGAVIQGLSVGGADIEGIFNELKAGLQQPLTGMGTAFSSSLFGLGGSLVLGFLDLQAGHAQNRFVNQLEEWLSGLTRLSSGALGGDEQSLPAYVQALLEQTAENLDALQRVMSRRDEERHSANLNLLTLTEQIANLADQVRSEQKLMLGVARQQSDLQPLIQELIKAVGGDRLMDVETREHLRSLDKAVGRLDSLLDLNRSRMVEELRGEIRLLTRTVARMQEGSETDTRPRG